MSMQIYLTFLPRTYTNIILMAKLFDIPNLFFFQMIAVFVALFTNHIVFPSNFYIGNA